MRPESYFWWVYHDYPKLTYIYLWYISIIDHLKNTLHWTSKAISQSDCLKDDIRNVLLSRSYNSNSPIFHVDSNFISSKPPSHLIIIKLVCHNHRPDRRLSASKSLSTHSRCSASFLAIVGEWVCSIDTATCGIENKLCYQCNLWYG